jgi:hypothetical protein
VICKMRVDVRKHAMHAGFVLGAAISGNHKAPAGNSMWDGAHWYEAANA